MHACLFSIYFLFLASILSWSTIIVLQCRFDTRILVFVPWVNLGSFSFLLGFFLCMCIYIGGRFFSLCNPLFLITSPCRVQNAEVLCLGLVSVTVFILVMPLFKVTGGILLQMAPPGIPPSALNKCWRQVFFIIFPPFSLI